MTTPAIDPAVIERLRLLNEEGEPDVLQEVLVVFLADATGRIDAIAGAIDRRDAAALQRAAHTFKGAAASIGAHGLQRTLRELEALGKNGTLDGAPELLRSLRNEFAHVEIEAARLLDV